MSQNPRNRAALAALLGLFGAVRPDARCAFGIDDETPPTSDDGTPTGTTTNDPMRARFEMLQALDVAVEDVHRTKGLALVTIIESSPGVFEARAHVVSGKTTRPLLLENVLKLAHFTSETIVADNGHDVINPGTERTF